MKNDRGATALLVAASLVGLMGIAALVVDGGAGFSERRQAQSAVDFAALAALQFATSCETACSPANAAENGADEAKAVVAANLPGRSLDWDACTDGTKPGEYTVPSSTDCISFTANFDKARVVLPDNSLGTSFARAIGFQSLTISAFAEAEQDVDISAAIVPFVPNGGGAEICLYTNQAPQAAEPCDGPSTGNFGYIDIALYGDDDLGTPSTCASGNQNAKVAVNISKGSDHILTVYNGGDPVIGDHDACPNRSENINEVIFEQGSPTQAVTDGLFAGVSTNINGNSVTGSARLACDSGNCRTIRGRSLDNRPLWTYAVGACGGVTDRPGMEACLNAWTPADGVIFSTALAANKRFVAIPDLAASPTGGPKDRLITAFLPVWLETIYMGNCTGAPTCSTIFSPGGSNSGACPNPIDPAVDFNCGWTSNAGQNRIQQLTAFKLELGMLPESIRDTFPGQGLARTFALTK